ncbi:MULTISPECIES: CvpA family protein [Flavobacterium]|uniref:CvpA family protein n=1 Tax=Flavobacterium hankyongi TaxID=1176532 RepID=A0ABP8ZMB9_9FLAO|nr:CvpA family protein [Flavobacterium sp. N1846]
MSFLDIILIVAIAIGFFKGYKNGLFVELASLIAFFIGVFIAVKFSYITQGMLENHVSWSPKTITVASFLITLFAFVIGIHLLAKIISSIADFAFLGILNSLLGGTFGAIKTALFFGILLNLFQKVDIGFVSVDENLQEKTLLVGPCMKTAEFLLPVLSEWFDDVKKEVKEFDKAEDGEFDKDTVQ